MDKEMTPKEALMSNMVKIENVSVEPLGSATSAYIKPFRMQFLQNSLPRYWDLVRVLDSVYILIYNRTRDVLVLVRQFRPVVYFTSAAAEVPETDLKTIDWSKVPGSAGITLELCAGVMDKKHLSPQQIAKEEVLEECGYDVPLENLELITKLQDVGETSSSLWIFYAEVDDQMKVNEGGGNPQEGEFIQVVEKTIPEIKDYINQGEMKSPASFAFAITWFLLNRNKSRQNN